MVAVGCIAGVSACATRVPDVLCWHGGLLPAGEATQESDLRIEIYMHVWRGDRASLLSLDSLELLGET